MSCVIALFLQFPLTNFPAPTTDMASLGSEWLADIVPLVISASGGFFGRRQTTLFMVIWLEF